MKPNASLPMSVPIGHKYTRLDRYWPQVKDIGQLNNAVTLAIIESAARSMSRKNAKDVQQVLAL